MEQLMGSTATEAPVQPCGQQQTGKLISICTTAKWPSGYCCCCCCCCLPPFSPSLTISCLPLASLLLPQRVVHFANEQQALPCCHRYRLLPSACRATLLPCCLLPPPQWAEQCELYFKKLLKNLRQYKLMFFFFW